MKNPVVPQVVSRDAASGRRAPSTRSPVETSIVPRSVPGRSPAARKGGAVARANGQSAAQPSSLPFDASSPGVGARLRYLREAYGLSMRELARRAGLNHGTVGCIEKETISPSVGSLRKLLDSFPITLSDFFSLDLDVDNQVFFDAGELLEVGGNGVSLKQVGRKLASRPLQVLHERYAPGAETAAAPYSHAGEEGGVVVAGRIELTVGHQTRVLTVGEAYLFPSRLPHRFHNPGPDECVIVSAMTPPV